MHEVMTMVWSATIPMGCGSTRHPLVVRRSSITLGGDGGGTVGR